MQQFRNPANPKSTGKQQGGIGLIPTVVDFLVAGVGTGGTLQVAEGDQTKTSFQAVAAEQSAAQLFGGKPGAHKIQGIGAGFIPEVLEET